MSIHHLGYETKKHIFLDSTIFVDSTGTINIFVEKESHSAKFKRKLVVHVVPEKMRCEMNIRMQNEIQPGIRKLLSYLGHLSTFQIFKWQET